MPRRSQRVTNSTVIQASPPQSDTSNPPSSENGSELPDNSPSSTASTHQTFSMSFNLGQVLADPRFLEALKNGQAYSQETKRKSGTEMAEKKQPETEAKPDPEPNNYKSKLHSKHSLEQETPVKPVQDNPITSKKKNKSSESKKNARLQKAVSESQNKKRDNKKAIPKVDVDELPDLPDLPYYRELNYDKLVSPRPLSPKSVSPASIDEEDTDDYLNQGLNMLPELPQPQSPPPLSSSPPSSLKPMRIFSGSIAIDSEEKGDLNKGENDLVRELYYRVKLPYIR